MARALVTINYVAGTTAKVAGHTMNYGESFKDVVDKFWDSYHSNGAFYNFSTVNPGESLKAISVAKSAIVDIIIEDI